MKWIAIILAAAIGAVVLYRIAYPTYSYRYRITVNVDVGGETRSESSVVEVRISKQPQFLPEVGPLSFSVRGQAVFVELPGGRNLVALLASGATGADRGYPQKIVPAHFKLNLFRDQDLLKLSSLHGRWELAPEQLPTLVTVTNPNDGATTQVVRFDQIYRQLGVHLRSITVDMTTDPRFVPEHRVKAAVLG